ncbi:hypothetical protein ACFOWE_03680 [Planomonospora corallina]|uniref:Uncharacterized protein n=1 Tax=Planomonospora corallina TaxID=1806052 RepID=A0ABV8HZW6_9ACTN
MVTTMVWIDATGDNPQERYGERLRRWRQSFAGAGGEPQAGGITLDRLRYALAAWEVATGPVAYPPYVRFHPRVLDAACHRPEDARVLLTVVELAAPPPVPVPDGWLTWRDGEPGRPFTAPPYDARAALGALELRIPIAEDRLPTPTRPEAEGLPNLGDAQAALEALVAEINTAAAPFLRDLEGGA